MKTKTNGSKTPVDRPDDFAEDFLNSLNNSDKIIDYNAMKDLIKDYLGMTDIGINLLNVMKEEDYNAVYETMAVKHKILLDAEQNVRKKFPLLTDIEYRRKALEIYNRKATAEKEVIREIVTRELPSLKQVKSYNRGGKTIKSYARSGSIRYSPVEIQYLKTRQKTKNKELVLKFNSHFSNRQRSYSSLISKRGRIK